MTASKWTDILGNDEYRQKHILEGIQSDEKLKEKVINQLDLVENNYPGGVINYIKRSRQFLKDAVNEVNPWEGFRPEKPSLVTLNPETDPVAFLRYENIGLENLDKIAFVLVAGGLGERLGYPDIKLKLPVDVCTETSFLQYYVEHFQAFEAHVKKSKNIDVSIPLAIMCSEDTYARTVAVLNKEPKNFGWSGDITVMKQEKVPSLNDVDGSFVLNSEGLDTKPHGHGDVHSLLTSHQLPSTWAKAGKTHMCFMQDTNPFAMRMLPSFLGASVEEGYAMNSSTVQRVPGEAVGAVCRLVNDSTKEEVTVNVEYNQLAPLLISAGLSGDVADPSTGFSPYPGNTNTLLFKIDKYMSVTEKSGGNIPEFINPKFTDASKSSFKAPTRLECMMQEFARLLSAEEKVGCCIHPRWLAFSVVKNSNEDAIAKIKSNGLPDCAFSGECEFYNSNCKLLQVATSILNTEKKNKILVEIGEQKETEFNSIKQMLGPKVVLKASFAFCISNLIDKFSTLKNLSLKSESMIILDSTDLSITDIQNGLVTYNDKSECSYEENHKFIKTVESDELYLKIRGYKNK